ncbi:hypothetical protein D3C81_962440 [compost metagenome]
MADGSGTFHGADQKYCEQLEVTSFLRLIGKSECIQLRLHSVYDDVLVRLSNRWSTTFPYLTTVIGLYKLFMGSGEHAEFWRRHRIPSG